MYKLRNCIIENTPTETFPQMVTITKAPKLRSHFVGKRYLDKDRAEIAIELWESERMISSKEKYVKKELEEIGLLPLEEEED
jgi:hypothetical protein